MQKVKIIAVICFAFFVKLFVFQPFVIPSSSMDRTLIKGDYVMVNKWQNSLFGNQLNIQKGNIIAFHYPLEKVSINDKRVFIKRCVANPGDTLVIENGETSSDYASLQFDYIFSDSDKILSWEILKEFGIHLGGRVSNDRWILSLDSLQMRAILSVDSNFVFNRNIQHEGTTEISTFPSDGNLHWNRDYYGPLIIPQKGMKVKLDTSNLKIYQKIISEYENHSISLNKDTIILDGRIENTYVFEQNYYFMLGDNRHHSQDSRYWGFVPEDHIIGDCSVILFNAEDFSFNRFLKTVD